MAAVGGWWSVCGSLASPGAARLTDIDWMWLLLLARPRLEVAKGVTPGSFRPLKPRAAPGEIAFPLVKHPDCPEPVRTVS